MATELTGTIDTLESEQRATPIGMDRAEGPFEANVDQDFVALEDVELLLEEYLHISGGAFDIESEVDFGASFGLRAAYLYDRIVEPPADPNTFLAIGFGKKILWSNSDQEPVYPLEVSGLALMFNGDPITINGLVAANNLSDLSDASVARGNLGLGTAAVLDEGIAAGNLTTNTTVDGKISTAISALSTVYQPLDATLTTISGNGTTGTSTSPVVLADAPTFTTGITTPAVTGGTTLTLGSTGANPVIVNVGGSEAARFAATTRNLLINTTTDNGAKFQVNGLAFSTSAKVLTTGGLSQIQLGDSAGGGSYSAVRLDGNGGGDNWIIGTQYNVSGALEITPSTTAGGATFTTPAVCIMSNSNVLVGTTTDDGSNKLQVSGSAILNASSQVVFTASTSDTASFMRYVNSGNSAVYTGSTTSGDFDIQTTSTTRLRVAAAGNVLIGTTTDDGVNKLQVNGSALISGNSFSLSGSSANAIVSRIENGNNSDYLTTQVCGGTAYGVSDWIDKAVIEAVTGSGLVLSTYSGHLLFQVNARTNAGAISSAGNWVLGTTTDNGTDRLQISGSAITTGNFSIGAANTGTRILTVIGQSPSIVVNGSAANDRDIRFQTAGSLRWVLRTDGTAESGSNVGSDFYINARSDAAVDLGVALFIKRSTGNVLIGSTTDDGANKLQVNGTGAFAGNQIGIATAQTPASATATGTTGTVCWDSSYIYVCTATNTWKRSAIATW